MGIKVLFCKFAVLLIALLAAAVMIPYCMEALIINAGLATRANQSELQVKSMIPMLTVAPDITKAVMPQGCEYLILDKEFHELSGNMDSESKETAILYAKGEYIGHGGSRQFALVVREKEICVLQYFIGSQFTVSWLPEYFPSPDTITFILIFINSLLVIIILTAGFAKNLCRQLTPFFQATEEVAKQNLDFEVGHSKVKEFNDVLLSFSDMKESLKTSLEKQWKAEQAQKEQIAALVHDLKTPLTVIQGNSELLSETNLNEEQMLYTRYIADSSEQMQSYIGILIDISRAAVGYQLRKKQVDFLKYMTYMEEKINSLCCARGIGLQMHIVSGGESMEIDTMLMERAIMNVIDNALEYSPQKGTIYVEAECTCEYLQISVTDEGKGFSREALTHAKERFFMDDSSRNSKMHFGMGLFIAASIMQQHGGKIILENDTITHGAKVIMYSAKSAKV